MKKLSTYIAALFWTIAALCPMEAQQHKREKPDINEFHEKKWNFITTEAALSATEAEAVKPIFMTYERKKWELHEQIRQLLRQAKNGEKSDKDYSALNDKMINNEIKRAQYLRDYHLRLKKELNPRTLFRYYKSEKNFERQLLNRRPHKGKQPDK